jgi:hypothetical protein
LFGLIAGSGELAVKLRVLPWPEGEANWAAATCFEVWLKTRGGTGSSDLAHGIRHVRHFLQTESARFWDYQTDERQPLKLVGYKHRGKKRETRYCVLPTLFEREACGGYDYRPVAQELKRMGFLITENGRLQCRTPKLPDGTRPRTYVIRGPFIEEEEVE